jgi:hypothetical protein
MKKYKIVIEETLIDTFEVLAGSIDEARKVAIQKYKDSEFVLEPGECQHRQLMVLSDENKTGNEAETGWVEF